MKFLSVPDSLYLSTEKEKLQVISIDLVDDTEFTKGTVVMLCVYIWNYKIVQGINKVT